MPKRESYQDSTDGEGSKAAKSVSFADFTELLNDRTKRQDVSLTKHESEYVKRRSRGGGYSVLSDSQKVTPFEDTNIQIVDEDRQDNILA